MSLTDDDVLIFPFSAAEIKLASQGHSKHLNLTSDQAIECYEVLLNIRC